MPTVDLPAHNVSTANTIPGSQVTIVGGPEALATTDPSTYVHVRYDTGDPDTEPRFNVGYDEFANDQLGFGVWTPPAGATVTSIQFVGEGYRVDGLVEDAQADFDAEYGTSPIATFDPVVHAPLALIFYTGDPFSSFGGYNLSTFPSGATPGESIAPGQINLSNYVIAPGPSTGPRSGGKGLGPGVKMAAAPGFLAGHPPKEYVITYLAIRITYTGGDIPELRGWGRPKARGRGDNTAQSSARGWGSIL